MIILRRIVDGLLGRNKPIIEDHGEHKEISKCFRSSYDASMMTHGEIMRTIQLSEVDAQQVKAILMTHAEMQDLGALSSTDVMTRLIASDDHDSDTEGMIDILADQVGDLEWDSDNLKRIANLF